MAVFAKAVRIAVSTALVVAAFVMQSVPVLADERIDGFASVRDSGVPGFGLAPADFLQADGPLDFFDVQSGTQFFTEIQWLSNEGISSGWLQPDGQRLYQPLLPVARDAMAAFMYRFAGSPEFSIPVSSPFADIDVTTQFYREMAWLADQNISTGWTEPDGSRTYRPLSSVNRDAMAAFMYRLAGSPTFTAPSTSPFTDVPAGTQFYKEITWLASSGITTGWAEPDGSKTFRPVASVARDAMAAFMYRFRQFLTGPCPTTNQLSGNVSRDRELVHSCSTSFVMDGDFTVDQGATLTIPAGTTVKAAAGARLMVEGTLLLEGTDTNPILLTSMFDQNRTSAKASGSVGPLAAEGAPWNGIHVQWGGRVSATHLQVQDTTTGLTALASPTSEATTRLELQATSFSQSGTCLSLQGPVVGHFHGSVSDCSTGVAADYPFNATQVQWGTGLGPGDGSDGRPSVDGPDINVFPWVGAKPVPAATANVPDTRDLVCGDYYFIGVMGSGEGGDVTPDAYFGPRIQDVYDEFKRTIHETDADAVIHPHGIDYPANAVPFVSGLSSMSVQSLSEYVPGAWQGALNVLDTVAERERTCGTTNEKIVIAGYSQGAWAVHVALNYAAAMENMNAANKINLDKIAAVGLLADPLRRYDGREAHLGTATLGSGIANVLKLGGTLYSFADWAAARGASLGLPAPDPNTPMSSMLFGSPIPGMMLSKTASFCNAYDPVCSWGETASPPDFGIHGYSNVADRASLGRWLAHKPATSAQLGIVATSLPAGTIGQRYHFALRAVNGTAPYSWSLSGDGLPPGLYLDSYNGVIAGVPTATGTAAIGLTVKDQAGSYGPARTTLTITAADGLPSGALTGIREISSSGSYAVREDGTVWAWGINNFGQLGNGTTSLSTRAVQVASISNIQSVTANDYATALALKRDGSVWGWGANSSGLLAAEVTITTLPPRQIPGLAGITSLAIGGEVAYAVKSDGTVWSWGSNRNGLLGRGLDANTESENPDPIQIPELFGVAKIITDGDSSFALMTDGSLKSWGANYNYQLGHMTDTTTSNVPREVPGLSGVRDVILRPGVHASSTVYALTTDGSLWAWGKYAPGGPSWMPEQVQGIDKVAQVATNGDTTLATAYDGELWSWGWGGNGLLGNGMQENSAVPARIPGIGGVSSIMMSEGNAYAITEDGGLWTWGINDLGLLGVGNWTTYSYSFEPRRLQRLPEIRRIVRNNASTYALAADGTALAWGYNSSGNTGTGLSSQFIPTPSPIVR